MRMRTRWAKVKLAQRWHSREKIKNIERLECP